MSTQSEAETPLGKEGAANPRQEIAARDTERNTNNETICTLTSTTTQALSLPEPARLPEESERLSQLERTIERNLSGFREVWEALLEIREKGLYRATHGTFAEYCWDRWRITDRRARQIISAAKTIRNIGTGTTVPVLSERSIRPLTDLEPSQQRAVWDEACKVANGKIPTEAHVKRARAKLFPQVIEVAVVVLGSATPRVTVTAFKTTPIYAKRTEGKPASQDEVEKHFEKTWRDAWVEFRDKYLGNYHSANRAQVKALIRDWMAGLPTVRASVEAGL